MIERFIRSKCDKCGREGSVALSDVISKKTPSDGLPSGWKIVGDFVDYCQQFTLCDGCVTKWKTLLQSEIERFVKEK